MAETIVFVKHSTTKQNNALQHLIASYTDSSCLDIIFKLRYAGFVCPKCDRNKLFTRIRKRRSYQCDCGFQVYPTAGTVFSKTSTPLSHWWYAILRNFNNKKGTSAKALERALCVTYKTAWRISNRIKYLFKNDFSTLKAMTAPIEVDVTQVNKTWFTLKKKNDYTPQYVIGFYQRLKESDNVIIKKLPDNKPETIDRFIRQSIAPGCTIYCELGILPASIEGDYIVNELDAKEGEHVRGEIHINNLKNVWRDLKRNIKREYISVSPQHLQGYCNEVAWKINNRGLSDSERFCLGIKLAVGSRHMSYQELTSRNPKKKSV